MLRLIKKQGFTLIELMVVIVIIGVLASLAIPRFSEASDKAKVAEAPRIIASFESAYLATKAEVGEGSSVSITEGDIIFNVNAVNGDSKWFSYSYDVSDNVTGLVAAPQGKIGKIQGSDRFYNSYLTSGDEDRFVHCFSGSDYGVGRKYVPNFLPQSSDGGC
jgi:prepilin-type N-terminal cleavage/methylation domain-containing protein